MKTKLQKWGNSLALRIPKTYVDEAGFQKDTPVELSIKDGKLVISPVVRTKLNLDNLLEKVTEENLPGEFETGPAVGREMW